MGSEVFWRGPQGGLSRMSNFLETCANLRSHNTEKAENKQIVKRMGNLWSQNESEETPTLENRQEDWPWIWAIIDPETLDWKSNLPEEEIIKIAKVQADLPVQISEYLYLSDARRAHDVKKMVDLKITHVLNMAGREAKGPKEEYSAAGIEVLDIEAEDSYGYPIISKHLSQALEFIQHAKSSGGRCVVHCVAGINRSGVIVAAEKMLNDRINVLETVSHCRRARGNTYLWNESFVGELVNLARSNGLLGPKPGEPGSPFPPPPAVESFTASDETASWRKNTRKFNAQEVHGLFETR
jgi:atypical dual specificity phosphatase